MVHLDTTWLKQTNIPVDSIKFWLINQILFDFTKDLR